MSTPILRRALATVTIAIACVVGPNVRGADTDLSVLQQRVDRLEALTQRVEAVSAVKRLQHAYGHYSELGLWHDFADLFADTGIGHYTQGALDRDGIRNLFLKEVGQGRVGLADGRIYPHISMQPVVTVAPDGQSAKGRWHIMAMLGGYKTSASWAGGVYENEYVLERGVWKMKDVRYLAQYAGRYEAPGWTPTREPAPFHYTASRVGQPILDVPAPARGAVEGTTLATLGQRMADLAARAQRLSDEIEITNLQHAYAYYLDRKMWDDAAELFAADGTMEIGLQGVYVGRKSIRRGMTVHVADGINDHVHLQTIVSVMPDGRTAYARGTDLGMIGTGQPPAPDGAAGPSGALWTQSIYENQFAKQGGVWKLKAVHVYPRFIVDAEQGWAKDAQPAPGPSREFPPDRPPTESYEIYPRFHIAPLHFDHPVTGRPPQYPMGTYTAPRFHSGRPTAAIVKTASALEAQVTATERSLARSKAYHAAENLATAYGYYVDEFAWDDMPQIFSRDAAKELPRVRQSLKLATPGKSPDFLLLHQIVQPVIHVSPDARSAKIRARLFQLSGPAGGEGSWTSGSYENTAVDEDGTWKLSGVDVNYMWTAPSHGGWAHVTPSSPAAQSFHWRRP